VCRAEVLALQSALHALALDLPESSPSAAAKMRLMAQAEVSASMRGMQNREPRRQFEWLAWLISAAATAALIVVLFLKLESQGKGRFTERSNFRTRVSKGPGGEPLREGGHTSSGSSRILGSDESPLAVFRH
jgi:hypothetical protein